MVNTLEAKLRRIREIDAIMAVRLEALLASAGLISLSTLGMFLWYAVIRRHEVWDVRKDHW